MAVMNVKTALNHLKSIENRLPNGESSRCADLEVLLGLLRTFYMLGRKWGKSENCESSLLNIEEVINSTCLKLKDGDDEVIGKNLRHLHRDASKPIVHFYHSFWREMEESCLSSSHRSLVTSSSTEEVKVIDILESLLHNMRDLLQYRKLNISIKDHIDRLEELVRFLKNFTLLATFAELNNGQMEGLLTHVDVLVLDITRFTFSSWYYNSPDVMWYMQLKERIVPYQSNVCGIYVRVLQCIKVAGLSLPPHLSISEGHRLVLGDFVDNLLGLSWNPLYYHSHYAETFNRQMQNVYGGLAFLRTILRDHQSKFDELYEEMHDCIVDVICEAGNILCLFIAEEYEGLEGLLSDFEKNYKLIKGKKERHEYPLILASSFPQTDLLGFVNFVLKKLELSSPFVADIVSLTEEDRQTVLNGIMATKKFLKEVVVLGWKRNEELKAIWSRVVSVAYDAEFVLDTLVVGDALQSLLVLNTITVDIKHAEALGDPDRRREIISSQSIGISDSEIAVAIKMPTTNEEFVVGLDLVTDQIIEQLKSNKKSLDIASIVGMPGLGKTTLARKVYNDRKIPYHFLAWSWCCVSQVYNKKSLLLEILRGFGGLSIDEHLEKNAFDLADVLRKHLKGKRYLIVLDDVWSTEPWEMLRDSFPDDGKGSRILLTSRHRNVALDIRKDGYICCPNFLTRDESWKLLENKMRGCPSELLDLGMKIAQHCKGLPLMILIVAGLLSKMEPKRAAWEDVEENLGKVDLPVEEQYQKTLNLSYLHLPDYLKSCFLSFGAFQEDRTIPVRELLWLWVADGRAEGQFSEVVAENCLVELIERNLVMVGRRGSRGTVKSCVLHDLLHDFCKKKGNEEHFLHGLHGPELGTSIEPNVLYRLCVYFKKKEDFEGLKLLCPRLRNLSMYVPLSDEWFPQHRYDIFYKISLSKLLRVMDLRGFKLGPFFPGAIELLVHLRFLALSFLCTELSIPSSIDKLSNLETFIVKGVSLGVLLPDTVWNMKTLRHMCSNRPTYWKFPGENPKYMSKLENLRTLSTVVFSCQHDKEEVLRRVPCVRTLKYTVAGECTGDCKILALDFMAQLESLNISQTHVIEDLQFQFPQHLIELVLSGFQLPWSKITTIYKLPNLEVLKLLNGAFKGEMWNMVTEEEEEEEEEEGEQEQVFSKLRTLRLSHLDLDEWEAYDDHFPSLEKVTLTACLQLKEIPSFLGNISTLVLIEVDSGISLDSIEKFEDEFDPVKVKRI